MSKNAAELGSIPRHVGDGVLVIDSAPMLVECADPEAHILLHRVSGTLRVLGCLGSGSLACKQTGLREIAHGVSESQ